MRNASGLMTVIEKEGGSLRSWARRFGTTHSHLIMLRDRKIRPSIVVMDKVESALPQYHRDYLFPHDAAHEGAAAPEAEAVAV